MNADLLKAFAPTGVLRASLNVGNPVLANLDKEGKPFGISIDLAHALAAKLGVRCELVVNETAGKSVATVEAGRPLPKRSSLIFFPNTSKLLPG